MNLSSVQLFAELSRRAVAGPAVPKLIMQADEICPILH